MNNIASVNKDYYAKRLSRQDSGNNGFWNNHEAQRQRFEILSQVGELGGKSVLDVGCGFGDFCLFLWDNNMEPSRYTGIDLSYDAIIIAQSKFLSAANFICGDIMDFNGDNSFDYSIASGVFALSVDGWEDYMLAVCKRMFSVSRIGIGVNFLSTLSPNSSKDGESHYAESCKILKLLMKEISYKIILRHDYRLNDFTVFIYKDNKQ